MFVFDKLLINCFKNIIEINKIDLKDVIKNKSEQKLGLSAPVVAGLEKSALVSLLND